MRLFRVLATEDITSHGLTVRCGETADVEAVVAAALKYSKKATWVGWVDELPPPPTRRRRARYQRRDLRAET
jgi:hypothetical protein